MNSIFFLIFQVKSELDKNHDAYGATKVDLEKTGIMVDYTDPATGFNAFKYLQLYLSSLNKKNNRMFQKPWRLTGKKFSLHHNFTHDIFENAAIGENSIDDMCRTLCDLVDKPELTNHSVRTAGITILKNLGVEDRLLQNVSGIVFHHFI